VNRDVKSTQPEPERARPAPPEAIARSWEEFVATGNTSGPVRDRVRQSWERCRAAEVDPERAGVLRLSEEELKTRMKEASSLTSMIAPVLDSLGDNLAASEAAACAFDWRGCLVRAWGDVSWLPFGSDGPLPGIVLDEESAGTTAVGMTLANNQQSWCDPAEHYCRQFQRMTDAAVPVYNQAAQLIGVTALFAPAVCASGRRLLGLAKTAVIAATERKRFLRARQTVNRYGRLLAGMASTSAEPMVLVGPRGYIRQINPGALRLLGLTVSRQDRPLGQVARFTPALMPSLCVEKEVRGMPMRIVSEAGVFEVVADGVPLRAPGPQFIGTLLTFHARRAVSDTRRTGKGASASFTFDDILGESEPILRAKRAAAKAAASSVNVLLQGPSGTGKEIFAQAIHNESDRRDAPFVSVNCAAIPPELIESELFGYQDGAFTGARRGGMVGKFEAADRGTIFLDEIGDMPINVQSECLRVLENRAIVRIGEHEEIPVNIRVIAATNKRLTDEVLRGQFREDLYYRLSVFRITLPPLRDCMSDIRGLVNAFIERFNNEMSREVARATPAVMERFMARDWPGNIRELKNEIEHAVMVDTDGIIDLDDLPEERLHKEMSRDAAPAAPEMIDQFTTYDWTTNVRELGNAVEHVVVVDSDGIAGLDAFAEEPQRPLTGTARTDSGEPLADQRQKLSRDLDAGTKELYEQALALARGNVTRAAKALGVGRATFYRKMKQLHIDREQARARARSR